MRQINNISPPELLLPWLIHQSSLTDKLKIAADDACLTVIRENWREVTWWEKFVFNINGQATLQREIIMSANNEPCWYARTIIPDYTYNANESVFDRLKQETLREVIFNNKCVKRHSLVYYATNSEYIEYYWLDAKLTANLDLLWVRKSSFSINNDFPFYLIEIFLPGLTRYCK